MRNVCKNVSTRPTYLFCRFCWNDSACSPFPASTTQLFSLSVSSHTLCSCNEIFSTINNNCNFRRRKFQQISTQAFWCWEDIFTQEWKCKFSNHLCKCTESPSTLSTNSSIELNLNLSWSSHYVTSIGLEMNVGSFSEHQNRTSVTDRYKGYLFTACLSQVNKNTTKRNFEQRFEM